MKLVIASIVLLAFTGVIATDSAEKCAEEVGKVKSVPTEWITMADSCTIKMKKQIGAELKAAMTYLAMGAYFSRDTVNRPGFAKFFFESASEEREHASKLISYLAMRGDLNFDLKDYVFENLFDETNTTWISARDALEDALLLEKSVTSLIRGVIKDCEAASDQDGKVLEASSDSKVANDYHLVDYLTGDFLEEQYQGQRHLAGMLSTLSKMTAAHGELADFLFDKKVLNGEV